MSSLRMLRIWRYISIFVAIASVVLAIAAAIGLVRVGADYDPKDRSLA
ncbi:hypothetical protein Igag_1119 [Ignisphaera aggregans DSM 17230]|uniref:Uncharacterized protein n=1 Tax=Ignisphaera aggregans (strain DSM 17230 / JCM 13409 / AQ1.S1) TaxID=583356 RepID=E0SNY5_IGNAA|nr:hypothetical protein Igag_1119 [Ignisphaera aggregans DSM 17230]